VRVRVTELVISAQQQQPTNLSVRVLLPADRDLAISQEAQGPTRHDRIFVQGSATRMRHY